MRFLFATACAFGLLASINTAHAVGCLTGAVAGGIAGHYAGHHAVLGAVAGGAARPHLPQKHERAMRRRRRNSRWGLSQFTRCAPGASAGPKAGNARRRVRRRATGR
jgi:hypothetical protein